MRFITDTITLMLAKPARRAGITPGRRMISRSGAAGWTCACASGPEMSSAISRGSGRTKSASASATSETPAATSHGIVRTLASRSLPEKSGLKTAGPRIAPKTAPLRT
ncbi:MAG TPA: hypothetical protein VNB86_10415 [Gaiellaceae bacterium]|nr:hypothetical protein [Gaiellaceae bacterium]